MPSVQLKGNKSSCVEEDWLMRIGNAMQCFSAKDITAPVAAGGLLLQQDPVLLLRGAAAAARREHRHASFFLHRSGVCDRQEVEERGPHHAVVRVLQDWRGGVFIYQFVKQSTTMFANARQHADLFHLCFAALAAHAWQ